MAFPNLGKSKKPSKMSDKMSALEKGAKIVLMVHMGKDKDTSEMEEKGEKEEGFDLEKEKKSFKKEMKGK